MNFDAVVGSEQNCRPQTMDPRWDARRTVHLRTIVADKAGLGTAQLINLSERGCRLCLTKTLIRGQYLTLKVYSDDGTAALQIDLAVVIWTEDQLAGIEFLSLSQGTQLRLTRLCGD